MISIKKFQETILSWYAKNRRDLPWRNTKDPYKILVSEIMLQQTQVPRVLPKYKEFLKAFPTFETLSKAPDKKLLKVWQGLGYWRRAKYLKETAKIIVKEEKTADLTRRVGAHVESEAKRGVKREEKPQLERNFPKIPEQLEKLPGIGHYTARAIACFAFDRCEAFLDTNIRRVYLHFFFQGKENVSDKEIFPLAKKAIFSLPKEISPREWHYALFDYGATVLKGKAINKRSRHHAKQSKFEGSFRSFRTKALRFVLSSPKSKITHEEIEEYIRELIRQKDSTYSPASIIDSLLKDDLLKKSPTHYFL